MARDRFPRVFRGPVGQPVHVQLAFQYAIVRAWAKRGYEARFGCFLALTRPLQADNPGFAHFFALFSCRSVWLDFRRSLPVDVDFDALRQDTVTEVGFMALSWYMCDTTRDTVGLPRLDFRRPFQHWKIVSRSLRSLLAVPRCRPTGERCHGRPWLVLARPRRARTSQDRPVRSFRSRSSGPRSSRLSNRSRRSRHTHPMENSQLFAPPTSFTPTVTFRSLLLRFPPFRRR